MTTMQVHAAGRLSLLQDLGRPGQAALGVPRGGAADHRSLALANRAVGNPGEAAGVEVLLGGLEVEFDHSTVVCVTGAPLGVTVHGKPVAFGAPVVVPAAQRLTLGAPTASLRSYLAIRGGVSVPHVLGSAGSSPTAGIGPAPLKAGDVLTVGAGERTIAAGVGSELVAAIGDPHGDLVLMATLGPRDDWFAPTAIRYLTTARWKTTPQADRVGVRLEGPVLERAVTHELPSEGVVPGSVQVPASGQPIVFGPDHPTTGGYPVIAVVREADLAALYQARPGTGLRFRINPPRWH